MNEILVLILGIILGISGIGIIKLIVSVYQNTKRSKSNETSVNYLEDTIRNLEDSVFSEIEKVNNIFHDDLASTVEDIYDEFEEIKGKLNELSNKK